MDIDDMKMNNTTNATTIETTVSIDNIESQDTSDAESIHILDNTQYSDPDTVDLLQQNESNSEEIVDNTGQKELFIQNHPYWFLYSDSLLVKLYNLYHLTAKDEDEFEDVSLEKILHFRSLVKRHQHKEHNDRRQLVFYFKNTFEWFNKPQNDVIKLIKDTPFTRHISNKITRGYFKKIKNELFGNTIEKKHSLIKVFGFWKTQSTSLTHGLLSSRQYIDLQINFDDYQMEYQRNFAYFNVVQSQLNAFTQLPMDEKIQKILNEHLFPCQYAFEEAWLIIKTLFGVTITTSKLIDTCLLFNDDVFNDWLFRCINNKLKWISKKITKAQRIVLFYQHSPALHLDWSVAKHLLSLYALKVSDMGMKKSSKWKHQQRARLLTSKINIEFDYHLLLDHINLGDNEIDHSKIFIDCWLSREIEHHYTKTYYAKCMDAINLCIKQKQINFLEYQLLNSDETFDSYDGFIAYIRSMDTNFDTNIISDDVISEVYNVLQLSLDDEKETEICLHFIKYFSDLIGKLNDDIEAGIEMISRYRQYALDNEDNAQLVLQANANIKQTLELMNKQNFVLMYQARTYFVHFLNTEYKQFDWYFEKVQQ
eukprot:144032_1